VSSSMPPSAATPAVNGLDTLETGDIVDVPYCGTVSRRLRAVPCPVCYRDQ
jgi:hypothetical protein